MNLNKESSKIYRMKEMLRLFHHMGVDEDTTSEQLAKNKEIFYRIIDTDNKYGIPFESDLDLFDICLLIKTSNELNEKQKKQCCCDEYT
jgi:hypothetical protein